MKLSGQDTSTVPVTHFNLQKLSLPYQRYPPKKGSYRTMIPYDSEAIMGPSGAGKTTFMNVLCGKVLGCGGGQGPSIKSWSTSLKDGFHESVWKRIFFLFGRGGVVETQGEQKVWRHIDWLIDIELYPDALIILHMTWSPPQVFLSTPNCKPLRNSWQSQRCFAGHLWWDDRRSVLQWDLAGGRSPFSWWESVGF